MENRCPSCGHGNRADRRFCTECGGRLGVACPACGASTETAQKFCGACGAALTGTGARPAEPSPASYTPQHLADKILAAKAALEGERKQVTVLFADLKGSMELAEGLDAEDFHLVMQRFAALLAEGIHRFEGMVTQFTGARSSPARSAASSVWRPTKTRADVWLGGGRSLSPVIGGVPAIPRDPQRRVVQGKSRRPRRMGARGFRPRGWG
jgi:hypothetical protein